MNVMRNPTSRAASMVRQRNGHRRRLSPWLELSSRQPMSTKSAIASMRASGSSARIV
jgi:hypothetical protein